MKGLVLSGGYGTRLRPLTHNEAPMLYIGEQVGGGDPASAEAVDIAVDPLEGTKLVAHGQPDAITVLASATERYATPVRVVANHPSGASEFSVSTTMGLAEADLMIAVPPAFDANNWCSVFNVTAIGSAGGLGQIAHASGGDGPWNQDGGQTIFPSAGYPAGSHLLNVGRLTNRTYSVSASANLQLTSFESVDGTVTARDLFSGIVNIQRADIGQIIL